MFLFPDPNTTNTFTLGEKTWKWNVNYWELEKQDVIIPDVGLSFYQQNIAPTGAKLGDRWLNTNNMNEFIYVKISDSPEIFQWMDLSGDYPGDSAS